MASIQVPAASKQKAKKILNKVYESDRNGGFTQDKMGFSGSVLTAYYQAQNNTVVIQSGYYQEDTLTQMFQ